MSENGAIWYANNCLHKGHLISRLNSLPSPHLPSPSPAPPLLKKNRPKKFRPGTSHYAPSGYLNLIPRVSERGFLPILPEIPAAMCYFTHRRSNVAFLWLNLRITIAQTVGRNKNKLSTNIYTHGYL